MCFICTCSPVFAVLWDNTRKLSKNCIPKKPHFHVHGIPVFIMLIFCFEPNRMSVFLGQAAGTLFVLQVCFYQENSLGSFKILWSTPCASGYVWRTRGTGLFDRSIWRCWVFSIFNRLLDCRYRNNYWINALVFYFFNQWSFKNHLLVCLCVHVLCYKCLNARKSVSTVR